MHHSLSVLFALALTASPATGQSQLPKAVEWHIGTALEKQLTKNAPWVQLLDRSTMSIGRYRLKAGSNDGQSPHDRDEVYYVVAGKGQFTAAGETRSLAKGDLVFVAARAKHHFHDITKDLDVLVFFSTGIPVAGGMVAGPKPTEQTPYAEQSPRGATRIFYWFGPDSAGQVAIDYGRPRWQGQYAQFLGKPSGKRWRFGENFWTTLDTNMELTIGDAKVPIGHYYVALQNDTKNGLELLLLDPQPVRKQRLDAYEVTKTTGGIRIPVKKERAKQFASRLTIELSVDRKERDRGTLVVTFGGNEMRADVVMHPHR